MKKRTQKTPSKAVEIYLVFQPILDMHTYDIYGYEALMRGKHKSIMPEKIFREAYREGRVTKYDIASLKESFKVLPRLEKGKHLFVNIEPLTLGTIFGRRKDAEPYLKKIRPYADRMIVEVTERLKPWDFETVKKGIMTLKKIGVKVALDDVGGVGAELLKLLTLKPDFIKIDRELITNLSKGRVKQESLKRLVLLAKKKRVKMIAEGIETKSDFHSAKKMGIPFAQGYYFARPRKKRHSKILDYH